MHEEAPPATQRALGLWPSAPDIEPDTQCRFTVSRPRHFDYPAILLLLAEQPRHGYGLVSALSEFGLGKVDRPSVYRALAELERDRLITSWEEPPIAGTPRHVHAVTQEGIEVLDAWMSVIAQERASLDLVLQRYWDCNSQRLTATLADLDRTGAAGGDATERRPREVAPVRSAPILFQLSPERSSLVVEVRSNVGPVAFGTTQLTGTVELALQDGLVAVDPTPRGRLETCVSELRSGNALYDAELGRRIDVRRFPVVAVEMTVASRLGEGNRYQVAADVTIHGVTQRIEGFISATVVAVPRPEATPGVEFDHRLTVVGEHVLDIREFGMAVPSSRLFKMYPEVRLRLHVEADG